MNITDEIIAWITTPAGCFAVIIIFWIVINYITVQKNINIQNKKLKHTKNIIKLITKREIEAEEKKWYEFFNEEEDLTEEEKIEVIKNNFPIMVQEIKDVYNNKKFKQISAIDIFENHLTIPQDEELKIKNKISSFTALGLLGTFIGLMFSIFSIETGSDTIVQDLVKAIAPAIFTSIFGVVASLLASHSYTKTKAKYKLIANKLAEKMMLERPSDTNPDYFYDSFVTLTGQKYEVALKNIVDKFLEQMKESLTQDLKDYRDAINDAKASMLENEQSFIQAATNLEGTVTNINAYLQNTNKLNKNFEIKLQEFTTALDNFNTLFENTTNNTTTTLNNIQQLNSDNLAMNKKTLNTITNELDKIEEAFEIIKDMNINFRSEILQTPAQLDSSIQFVCQKIKEASNKLNETPTKLENSIDNICNKIDDLTTKLDKKTIKAINDIAKKVDEYTENNGK